VASTLCVGAQTDIACGLLDRRAELGVRQVLVRGLAECRHTRDGRTGHRSPGEALVAVAGDGREHVDARTGDLDLAAVLGETGELLVVIDRRDGDTLVVCGRVGNATLAAVASGGEDSDASVPGVGDGVFQHVRGTAATEREVDDVDALIGGPLDPVGDVAGRATSPADRANRVQLAVGHSGDASAVVGRRTDGTGGVGAVDLTTALRNRVAVATGEVATGGTSVARLERLVCVVRTRIYDCDRDVIVAQLPLPGLQGVGLLWCILLGELWIVAGGEGPVGPLLL